MYAVIYLQKSAAIKECYRPTTQSRRNTAKSASLNPRQTLPSSPPGILQGNAARNAELKRLQDPLRNRRMPFRIWHAWLLLNTEAGCSFLSTNHAFCFWAVWNLELKQNETSFVSTQQATVTKPHADSFQRWQSIPVLLLPMQSASTYIKTIIKTNDMEPQIPRSLLINANIRLSASGPHIRYGREILLINTNSRVIALPFSLK